jgi:hypothetical protein
MVSSLHALSSVYLEELVTQVARHAIDGVWHEVLQRQVGAHQECICQTTGPCCEAACASSSWLSRLKRAPLSWAPSRVSTCCACT